MRPQEETKNATCRAMPMVLPHATGTKSHANVEHALEIESFEQA